MFLEVDEISGTDPEDDIPVEGSGQKDPRPEYFQYLDEGCRRAKSCLDCPFSRCFYDLPGPRCKNTDNTSRDEDIRNLHRSGKSLKQLSRRYKVSRRTIERVLYGRRSRAGRPENEKGDMSDE